MTGKRIPSISALRVFEVAARTGSFVAAAAELNVTHGAVSKQVKLLEEDLGSRLFDRRNRGIHLTPSGAFLAERLMGLFAQLDDIIRDFRAQEHNLPLTVSCEPTLCLKLLIPALAELTETTGVDVRVLAAGGPIDLRRDRVDLAIRRNDFPQPAGTVATLIGDEFMGAVCHPDGSSMVRLHSSSRPDAWQSWEPENSQLGERRNDMHYEHFYMALQAAESGLGMAMASIHMVARDLELGRLVAPYGFRRDGTKYVALIAADNSDSRVETVSNWIAERMSENVTQWTAKMVTPQPS